MKQWGMMLESAVTGKEKEDVAKLAVFLASDEATFITEPAYNLTGDKNFQLRVSLNPKKL